MTSLSRLWALVGLLAALVAAAPLGKNTTGAHNHSTAQQGGTALLPVTLTVSGTATFNGASVVNGAETHTSTLTVGTQVYSSTANWNAVVYGGWADIIVSSFTNASIVYLTGLNLSTATEFDVIFKSSKTTQGQIKLNVNSNAAGNYNGLNWGVNNSGGSISQLFSAATFWDPVSCHSSHPNNGTMFFSHFKIFTEPGLTNDVTFLGQSRFRYSTATTSDATCTGIGATWTGTGQLATLTFTQAAGTMTGRIVISAHMTSLSP